MTKWTKNRVFLRGVRGVRSKKVHIVWFPHPPKEILATGLFTTVTFRPAVNTCGIHASIMALWVQNSAVFAISNYADFL